MTERYDQTESSTSEKALEQPRQMMRVMSEDEIHEHCQRYELYLYYLPNELKAIISTALLISTFVMTFADGRREFFDFRRSA